MIIFQHCYISMSCHDVTESIEQEVFEELLKAFKTDLKQLFEIIWTSNTFFKKLEYFWNIFVMFI